MSASDLKLMELIKAKWQNTIASACNLSSVPESFLAALIANESGGDPTAKRFESAWSSRLKLLHPAWDETHIQDNATSWGLTQIMGFHYPGACSELKDPATNLHFALRLLAVFCDRNGLDPSVDFEEMFRCWNTGRPDGKTYDPNYVSKGLARMEIYRRLA